MRDIALLGRKKGQQAARLELYVAGLMEDAMHGSAVMIGRNLNAERKGLDMHDRHSIAR